jgi:hypothetical protein
MLLPLLLFLSLLVLLVLWLSLLLLLPLLPLLPEGLAPDRTPGEHLSAVMALLFALGRPMRRERLYTHASLCTEHLRHVGFPCPHLTLAAWQLSHDVRYFGSRLAVARKAGSFCLAMAARRNHHTIEAVRGTEIVKAALILLGLLAWKMLLSGDGCTPCAGAQQKCPI